MRIGIVGLGRMGAPIARRLRQDGFEPVAWDQRAEVNEAAARDGVRVVKSPAEVARESEIISKITDDQGVRSIFAGACGFLSSDVAGKLFVEMSTLSR